MWIVYGFVRTTVSSRTSLEPDVLNLQTEIEELRG